MWIDPITKEVAKFHHEIRSLRPNSSLPNELTDDIIAFLGFVEVKPSELIYDDNTQTYTEGEPVEVDGVWSQTWNIIDLDDEVIQANLDAARKAKNEEINAARLTANFSYFAFNGKHFACDTLSRSDIDATNGQISLTGKMPDNWPGGWKAVDNSYVVILTQDDWKAFYKAMYDTGVSNFMHAQDLKTKLTNAKTLDEIRSLNW